MSDKKFDEETKDLNPLETLRFFCSEKLLPQAWLDSERLFFDIEKQLEAKDREIEGLKDALSDAVNGFAYIRQNHGELYGVGFDRIESHRKLLTKE